MTIEKPITKTSSTDQNHEPGQEQETGPRPLPDTDHYAEQTTRHEQQDRRTKGSRERSKAAHLCITIPGHGPASGQPGNGCHRPPHAVDLGRESATILSWEGASYSKRMRPGRRK